MGFSMEQVGVETFEGKIKITQTRNDGQNEYGSWDEIHITPEQAPVVCKWIMRVAGEMLGQAIDGQLSDEELDEKLNGYRPQ